MGTAQYIPARVRGRQAALAELSNQKLVLLSESDIPLYPPALVYQQLISEPRSRVNACPHKVHARLAACLAGTEASICVHSEAQSARDVV